MTFLEAMQAAREGKRVQREMDIAGGYWITRPDRTDEFGFFTLHSRRTPDMGKYTPSVGDIFAWD